GATTRSTLFPYTTLFRSHEPAKLFRDELWRLIGQNVGEFNSHSANAAAGRNRSVTVARPAVVRNVTSRPSNKSKNSVTPDTRRLDRKSTRLNSSHLVISY